MTRAQKILFALNAAYIVPAGMYFTLAGNEEFLLYVAQMVVILIVIALTINKTQFSIYILSGLSVWGALHMAGGGVPYGDSVLYAMPIWHGVDIGDTYIFKYDQFVHAFGFGVATFAVYHTLRRAMGIIAPRISFIVISVFAGMGLGAINEMIEFIPAVFVEGNGVGGYFNTALDLYFNALGAIIAGFIIAYNVRRKGKTLTVPVAPPKPPRAAS